MHTDESINACITGQLLAGGDYHYDPQDRHGPVLYLLAKPIAQLCGAKNFSGLTEVQLRLTCVFAGTGTVLLFGAAVEMFGVAACVIAAILFAFSPLPVYYSRDFIHETLFLAATFGLILTGWYAIKTNSILFGVCAGVCAALMLACKETAVIHFFAMGAAAVAGSFLVSRNHFPAPRLLASASLGFLAAAILLFTWGGQNWLALVDLFQAIPRFAARAGGEGHEKPFWYHAALLGSGSSGAILLALALVGMAISILDCARQRVFSPAVFISIYAIVIAAIYSAIPYKTPWLALNLWLPLALLAGVASVRIWRRWKSSGRWCLPLAAIVLAGLIAHDVRSRVFQFPGAESNPYAYAHTGEDLLRLPPRLEQLAKTNGLTQPRIAVVAADPWPLPWYLRTFSQVGFWQPGQDPGAADFIITSPEAMEKLGDKLKDFRPEYFGVRPEVIVILWVPVTQAVSHE